MITATGLGSGLDIDALVAGLVAAESQPPTQRLLSQEAATTSEIAGYSRLSAALSALESSVSTLNASSAFTSQTVLSDNYNEVVPILSGTSTASIGTYEVAVTNLAAAQTLASSTFSATDAVVGTGTLTIAIGTPTYVSAETDTYSSFSATTPGSEVAITIDNSNNTLAGVRDAINAASAGVTASIVKDGTDYRLLISADTEGVANSISMSVSGDGDGDDTGASGLSALAFDDSVSQMTLTARAVDAAFSINGLALTSSTNSVTDVLDGLSLTLKDVTSAVTVTVGYDDASIADTVNSFVSAYNSAITTLADLTSYDAASGIAGVLQGDSLARSAMTAIRTVVGSQVSGISGAITRLGEVGVSSNTDGTLSLDRTEFTTALQSSRDDVKELFIGDSTLSDIDDGVAGLLDGAISNFTSSTGLIADKTESLESRIDRIQDDREALDRRIEALEARYYRQFNALDSLIASLTSTGDFLLAQLDSMPDANRKDS